MMETPTSLSPRRRFRVQLSLRTLLLLMALVGVGLAIFRWPWVETTQHVVRDLCEFAIEHGYAFDYRYGALWLVPHADPEPPFVDPTGVSQIAWTANSPAARQWEEVIDVHNSFRGVAACVNQLLAGTSIQFDTTEIDPGIEDLENAFKVVFRRRRCDALGLVLYRTGCRCELRNGTLHVIPRSERTLEEIFRRPLMF